MLTSILLIAASAVLIAGAIFAMVQVFGAEDGGHPAASGHSSNKIVVKSVTRMHWCDH